MPEIDNIRLKELLLVVRKNKAFYNDFVKYLKSKGYNGILSFVNETSDRKARQIIRDYLESTRGVNLYDGIANPYSDSKAKWFFLAWLFRDAPAQRLNPLLKYVSEKTPNKRKAYLLNEIRKFAKPLFPLSKHWSWNTISEVMLARLEGSRRALKGNIFDGIVRNSVKQVLDVKAIPLKISPTQVKIAGETYDVSLVGNKGTILLPVKTRETMGGGHAMLFTRDIHKSISVATKHGYNCVPIIVAESWGGNLDDLPCSAHIYIDLNPNQVDKIEPILKKRLLKLADVFRGIA